MKKLNTILFVGSILLLPTLAFASAVCEVTLEGTDAMVYEIAGKKAESINVDAGCKKFTVHFKYRGVASKTVMGHNFVLTKSQDVDAVSKAATERGAAADFLPDLKIEPFKSKVLAASSKLLGGDTDSPKEEDIVVDLSKLKKGGDYSFFCTFPAHIFMMKGKLIFG